MTNYPSNLSDKQWNLVKSFLPESKSAGYERKHYRREMLNAIFYLNKTGCQWRYLPSDFAPWKSVYSYFRRLCAKNIFEKINSYLNIQIRLKDNRDPKPSLFCIDSQSIEGDVNLDQKGTDGNKKIKGRKRHIVTDVLGLIFFCTITAANVSDIHPGREFITQMSLNERLEKILVDGAYQGIAGKHERFTVEVSSKKPD